MRKGNVVNNKGLSSRKVWRPAGFRDLPSAKSLLNKEQQPYCMKQAEGPGQRPAGTTINLQGVGPVFARPARTGAPLRSGFTLIELLVVVLIIGILASVALPQYQKAVLKSRLMQDLVRVRALHDGAEMYYMANGFYPYDVRDVDLDITQGAEIKNSENFTRSDIPAAFYPDETECIIIPNYYAACGRIAADYYIQQNVEHQAVAGLEGGPGRQSCCGKKNARMDEVCKSLAHKTTRDWDNGVVGFNCYYLN